MFCFGVNKTVIHWSKLWRICSAPSTELKQKTDTNINPQTFLKIPPAD